MKFRKKPVVVEAVKVNAVMDGTDVPEWAKQAVVSGDLLISPQGVYVLTMEGRHFGDPSKWLIRGVKGELYCCDAGVFEQTYEPVNEEKPELDNTGRL